MSEHNDYPLDIKVEWVGYDTAQYVVTRSDTLLPVVVNSNCFQAIGRYRAVRRKPYTITTAADTVVKVGDRLFDDIRKQYGFHGTHGFKSTTEQLTFAVEERHRRGYVPQLRDVEFRFADQCGLSGSPVIAPDTVWVYGSPEHLDKIESLYTAPAILGPIGDSGYRTLALAPLWRKYPDLRVSTDSIHLFLPVDRYVEKTFSVPVRVQGADNTTQIRLYPERVDVTLWVPIDAYDQTTDDMVHVVADFNPDDTRSHDLPVRVTLFPANTRIRQIAPSAVQYVIIRL